MHGDVKVLLAQIKDNGPPVCQNRAKIAERRIRGIME
jgi:hypothetical protein